MVSADANRILIATSVWFGTHLLSNDFQCFYLESEMVEDVYVEQPKGFVVAGREDDVCKLRVGVYGVTQSGHHAQTKLVKSLTGPAGYKMHESQPMMFHRNDGTNHATVWYHVDDSLRETDSKEMFLKCVAARA